MSDEASGGISVSGTQGTIEWLDQGTISMVSEADSYIM